MAERSAQERKIRSFLSNQDLTFTLRDPGILKDIRVENYIGFTQVPVGLAGPLCLTGLDNIDNLFIDTILVPLATYKPTLMASCLRGYKAFNASSGLNFKVLGDSIFRALVFVFNNPGHTVAFTCIIPTF
jgi:hydroxymethylglutaryl-CoA reductase